MLEALLQPEEENWSVFLETFASHLYCLMGYEIRNALSYPKGHTETLKAKR